mmetsp:Transcript_36859/g.80840  ORF Transcript_36859/g.80840 Transcript_36859/m.80840 type:complete len:490 (-) Transcript_36859:121-1590(-)
MDYPTTQPLAELPGCVTQHDEDHSNSKLLQSNSANSVPRELSDSSTTSVHRVTSDRHVFKRPKVFISTAEEILAEKKRRASVGGTGWRPWALEFNDRRGVKIFVGTVICLNGIYLGIETDAPLDEVLGLLLEFAFTITFFVEVALRIFAEGASFFFEEWNIFDFVLVAVACLDTFIFEWIASGSSVGALSAIRMLRLVRLVRLIRLFSWFKELWLFVAGILSALRTLCVATPIVALLIYTCGITTTRIFGQEYVDDPLMNDWWGSVPKSMFTLFQCMTTEGWADIARHTMEYEPWSWVFFVGYIAVTTFAIVNVLVAVMVENVVSTAIKDAEDLERQAEAERVKACGNILQVFTMADTDGNRELSASEFQAALMKPEVKRWLAQLGIDVRQAQQLFDVLDYDTSGVLDFEEFVEGVMKARGPANAQDVLAVQYDVWRSEAKLKTRIDSVGKEVESSRKEIRRQIDDLRNLLSMSGSKVALRKTFTPDYS